MNEREARTILTERVASYRKMSYQELASLIDAEPETGEITGPSGELYQIEIEVFWDDKPDGNIRVLGGIDECPHKPIFWKVPMLRWIPIYTTDVMVSFIMSPSGQFIDEGEEEGDGTNSFT